MLFAEADTLMTTAIVAAVAAVMGWYQQRAVKHVAEAVKTPLEIVADLTANRLTALESEVKAIRERIRDGNGNGRPG